MITRLSDMSKKISPLFSMSVGNQIDMSNVDFLEWTLQENSFETFVQKENIDAQYYASLKKLDDEKKGIQVFGMYIEGLNNTDGARLIRLIQKAKMQNKHVVIYKSGRTQQGAHATAGHTASLASSYDMFKQLLETSGAILCDSFDEFEDTIYLLSHFCKMGIKKQGKCTVGIITNAGFEKCTYAD